ncbi:acetylserotonin O-methyltransferase-like isoform X2 [Pantherophis guttatus]|uniref:Acetylserotonin O-methyltransferase n=1 Tax=Pantherophis guttatus TaxID=94885 RepID=A0A6P9C8Q9_PANGU|nr:acetylserotonin O-methyltransferase-like isoform X2 [Pantherophis guttatus]
MSSTEEIKTFQTLFKYQHSFITFKVISTACELGIFDLLRESGELLSSGTLAEHLKTSPIGLQRLLEACVGLKLLTLEWKDGKDFYGNTDFTNLYLVKSSPKSQYYSMKFYSEVMYPSMQHLPEVVRKGKNQSSSIYGTPNVFEIIYRSKEELQTSSSFLNELWPVLGREVLSAFDLSQFPLICDVGAETFKNHCLPSEDSQITFHAGDFFKDPIPEADLYILARTLHDWSDEGCLQLLRKVYQACKPGGGVLIVEMLLDEDKRGPSTAHFYSLLMLVLTEGKERSATEFNVLLRKAGFQKIELKKGSLFHIILGRK